jgi:hypothetical protein
MSENKGVNQADAYREVAKANPKLFSRSRKDAYVKGRDED